MLETDDVDGRVVGLEVVGTGCGIVRSFDAYEAMEVMDLMLLLSGQLHYARSVEERPPFVLVCRRDRPSKAD